MARGGVSGAILALLLTWGGTGAARADWLVLRDGSRVETKGPWQTRERLVVFRDRRGNLASLRSDLIDEVASHKATRAAATAATALAPPPVRRKAVLVVTDDDVAKAQPVSVNPESPTAAESQRATNGPIAKDLIVTTWERVKTPVGIEVTGTLRNNGTRSATGVRLLLHVFDDQQSLRATATAKLSADEILAQETAEFSAVFAGLDDFRTLRFEPTTGEPAQQPTQPVQ
jgi:hypothetical protein